MLTPEQTQVLQSMQAVGGTVYLSTEAGTGLATLGMISVDATQVNPENPAEYACTITDAGRAAVAPAAPVTPIVPSAPTAPAAPATPDVVAVASAPDSDFTLTSNVVLPKIKRNTGGGAKKYPFDQMQPGQSFHIKPSSEEDVDKISRRMSGQCTKANNESEVPVNPPRTELVTKYRYIKDEAGNFVKDATTGKKKRESYQETEQVTEQTKEFVVRKVDAKDPEGVGVRVFRVR